MMMIKKIYIPLILELENLAFSHRMKKSVVLILAFLLAACEKEDLTGEIVPLPGWVVEKLNDEYYLQIPEYFNDNGTGENCINKMNPSRDIFISQCNCDEYFVMDCVGDSLYDPLPGEITRLPTYVSSSFMTLNHKEILLDEEAVITGVVYSSDGMEIENSTETLLIRDALFYKKVDMCYISMLRVQFNVEKVDTVMMIWNSIGKL